MWDGVGLLLCGIAVAIAVVKSRRPSGGYYERDVYGMLPRTHVRYAFISAFFAALFAAQLAGVLPVPDVPLLAVYVLVFVFYVSSFVRGFSDEE
jgi:hypothetical protein